MCQNGAVVLVRICHSPPVLQFRKWNSCKLLILSDLLWNLRRDSDREWSLYCTNTRHGGVCKNPAFQTALPQPFRWGHKTICGRNPEPGCRRVRMGFACSGTTSNTHPQLANASTPTCRSQGLEIRDADRGAGNCAGAAGHGCVGLARSRACLVGAAC